jgi:hypothetical protein
LKIRDSMFQHTNMDIEKLTCPWEIFIALSPNTSY